MTLFKPLREFFDVDNRKLIIYRFVTIVHGFVTVINSIALNYPVYRHKNIISITEVGNNTERLNIRFNPAAA